MTVSARVILAYLQLASWNHEDWNEVQPRSGTKECSESRRMEESSLGLTRSRIEGTACKCVGMIFG